MLYTKIILYSVGCEKYP